jgi:hypothetical protein
MSESAWIVMSYKQPPVGFSETKPAAVFLSRAEAVAWEKTKNARAARLYYYIVRAPLGGGK